MAARINPFPVDPRYADIYAHGVEAPGSQRTIWVSGQIGVAPEGGLPEDFVGQCRQAIENLQAVLSDADASLADIVKMSFFLTDREHMDDLVAVRREMLTGVNPAITTVVVAGLVSPDWLVEVEATAVAPNR